MPILGRMKDTAADRLTGMQGKSMTQPKSLINNNIENLLFNIQMLAQYTTNTQKKQS